MNVRVFLLLVFLASFRVTANESNPQRRNLSILLIHSYFPSHCFPVIALGAELVSRGHKVTALGSVLQDYQFIPELAESHGIQYVDKVIVPNEFYEGFRDVGKHDGETNWISLVYNMSSFFLSLKNNESDVMQVRKIFDTLNASHYDYIIAEQAISFILPYVRKQWNTTNTMSVLLLLDMVPRYAIPWPYPRYLSSLPEDMSFTDRFLNTLIYTPVERVVLHLTTSFIGLFADSKLALPGDFLTWSLSQPNLYNSVLGVLEWPRNLLPLQHYVGPMLLSNPSPLSDELLAWIDKGSDPIVYISMGTTALITTEIAQAILSLSTDYRLVWSLRESNMDILTGLSIDSDRVYTSPWISQFTLLQHSLVKLAILHCGLNGVQESLYNKVPVLCIPYGMDQHDVAFRLTHQKFGISLLPHKLNMQNLKKSIQTLENPLYQEQVNMASHLLKAGGGVKKGANLVELYAEIGYQHGLPSFIRYQWSSIQYYNIDVWLVMVCLLVGSIWMCNKCCNRWCCKKYQKTKKD